MIAAKALDELQLMAQQWRHHASKMRQRARECLGAAEFYHKAACHLGDARRQLDKAILEESAVEE